MKTLAHPLHTALLFLLLLAVSGCQKYAVSLNDRVIYTPPGLFSDYTLEDPKLAQCMLQTIVDLQATAISQVTRLNCSSAGISNLAGLEKFYALTQLNLADNDLQSVPQLAQLARLELLVLNDNPLVDPTPLLSLVNLKQLRLNPAPAIDCASLRQLQSTLKGQAQVNWPAQCGLD